MQTRRRTCALVLAATVTSGIALWSSSAPAGTLAKLTIQPDKRDKIEVMFNPKEVSVDKATPWKHHDIQGLDAPTLEFTSGEPYRAQFDITLEGNAGSKPVREVTDRLERLATKDPAHERPPLVPVLVDGSTWLAPLLLARPEFTAFARDGTPTAARVRTLWGAFTELQPETHDLRDEVPIILRTDEVGVAAGLWPAALSLHTLPVGLGFVEKETIPVDTRFVFDRERFTGKDTTRVSADVFLGGEGDVRDVLDDVKRMLAAERVQIELPGRRLLNFRIERTSLRYTLFLDDGTPVRAVMNMVWKEFSPAEEQLKGNPRH